MDFHVVNSLYSTFFSSALQLPNIYFPLEQPLCVLAFSCFFLAHLQLNLPNSALL